MLIISRFAVNNLSSDKIFLSLTRSSFDVIQNIFSDFSLLLPGGRDGADARNVRGPVRQGGAARV